MRCQYEFLTSEPYSYTVIGVLTDKNRLIEPANSVMKAPAPNFRLGRIKCRRKR